VHALTGPYSYTGRYIARRLLEQGVMVRGLVRRLSSNGDPRIECRELQFADASRLAADLRDVEVLYNTYWIRCPRNGMTFERAVENTRALAEAAATAGVHRVVHLSVTNPAAHSPFAYFRGKAAAEQAIGSTGVPASIVRPTLVFGREDILVNNIAWLLRRLRFFTVPDGGAYRVQPVYVGDVAELAVTEAHADGIRVIDAAGPEVLTFLELVRAIARSLPVRALVTGAPAAVTRFAGSALSRLLRDVLITGEELGALMAENLLSSAPPTARTRLSEWLQANGHYLGSVYASETARHWRK